MIQKKNKAINILFFIIFIISSSLPVLSQNNRDESFEPKPQLRFVRTFGDNETRPPVIAMESSAITSPIKAVSGHVNITIDVLHNIPPSLYVEFVHCDVNWQETENTFIQDPAQMRTSMIDWTYAPSSATYYSHRGHIRIPNSRIKFKFGGNWKAKFYLYSEDKDTPFAEARFFVVDPKANAKMAISTEFYEPEFNVTKTGLTIQTFVNSDADLIEHRMNTAVIYRNHRWHEPYVITEDPSIDKKLWKYRYKPETRLSGFSFEKQFYLTNVPAENEYRILYMGNLARFPKTKGAVRLPLSDIIRNGSFMYEDADGAMLTNFVSPHNDQYVYVEFMLNPENVLSNEDVFIVGTFTNWELKREWQMYYDRDQEFYLVRGWVRRGEHSYLYATGTYNHEKDRVENYSYDKYEGNTSRNRHEYLAFVYYKETERGGYYNLITVGSANIDTGFERY